MGVFKSQVDRREAEVAAAKRLFDSLEAEASALAAPEAEDLDFEARFALSEKRALCARKITAARGDVERCERNLAAEMEVEASAEGDRRHKEGEKLVPAGIRLVENVEAASDQLAAAIAALETNRAKIDAINAQRGSRRLIEDGETLLRRVPDRIEPAIFEEQIVWRDLQNGIPSQYRIMPDGEKVPCQAGYEKRRERVQMRAERIIPGRMPSRYADAIVLVNRKGERISPPTR